MQQLSERAPKHVEATCFCLGSDADALLVIVDLTHMICIQHRAVACKCVFAIK